MMLNRQKKMLQRVMGACEWLGNNLDGTATHPKKYMDRQRAHSFVRDAVYGILMDDPNNPYREQDLEDAEKAIQKLEKLTKKEYPDRHGLYAYNPKEEV